MQQSIFIGSLLFSFLIISPIVAQYKSSQCGARNESPIRPCPQNEKNCVRSFFQCRFNCKSDVAPGDTLFIYDLKGYFPFFNLTIDQYNTTIGGLSSGKIVDFLVDYQTDLMVLSVNFMNLTVDADSDFVYYQTAKEPRHTLAKTTELYLSVTITTIFSSATNPNVNEIFSVANITALPIYTLGPCITKTTDPVLVNLFKSFEQNINVASQEAFQTRSKIIAVDYIQKNLCNYGA